MLTKKMRVEYKDVSSGVLRFLFHLDTEDLPYYFQQDHKVYLQTTSVTIRFPNSVDGFKSIHGDVWAAFLILLLHPFIKTGLQLSFPVTRRFARSLSFPVHPIDLCQAGFHMVEKITGRVSPLDPASVGGKEDVPVVYVTTCSAEDPDLDNRLLFLDGVEMGLQPHERIQILFVDFPGDLAFSSARMAPIFLIAALLKMPTLQNPYPPCSITRKLAKALRFTW